MAHCSSSPVNTPSIAACTHAHYAKSQELLPPRKRLLAGLKHVKAAPIASGAFTSTLAQSLHGEAHVAKSTHTHTPPPPPPP
eukprot:c21876_g2_i1 orf=2-244(-)